jgi:uncharacterized YigZ family protein
MEQVINYKTLAEQAMAEFKDRGSRFIAYCYPVNTVDEVKQKVQALKKEHPKANHHCVAFRIGIDGKLFRASDDGEPSGSAGRPMLGQIDSLGLTNILVVVVRYFGGTLLGVPGLINAYKTVTADALKDAPTTEKWVEEIIDVSFDYPAMSEVLYILKQAEATIYKQDLQLFCEIKAGIPAKHSAIYMLKLSEIRGVSVKLATQ